MKVHHNGSPKTRKLALGVITDLPLARELPQCLTKYFETKLLNTSVFRMKSTFLIILIFCTEVCTFPSFFL
jgi:hypothetical protein